MLDMQIKGKVLSQNLNYNILLVGEYNLNVDKLVKGVSNLGLEVLHCTKIESLSSLDKTQFYVILIDASYAVNITDSDSRILSGVSELDNVRIIILSRDTDKVDITKIFLGKNVDFIHADNISEIIAQRLRSLMNASGRLQQSVELKESLEKVYDVANLGYWTLRVDTCQMFFSNSALTLLNPHFDAVDQLFAAYLDLIPVGDREEVRQAIESCAFNGTTFSIDHRIIFPKGETRFFHVTGKLYRQDDVSTNKVLATIQDITDRKLVEITNEHFALYDSLTDLCNRRLFTDRLIKVMKTAKQNEKLVAVCFLDLDKFKPVNDSLGHAVGDELLKSVARRLKEDLRHGDVIARLGGDEFGILIDGVHTVNEIDAIMEKLQRSLAKPHLLRNHRLSVTVSIGITVFPMDSAGYEILLSNADAAMYKAKQLGGNCYCYYTFDMYDKAGRREKLANYLTYAEEKHELRVFYQPQFDSLTERMIGVEALVRWQHPEYGLLPPAKFLDIAEETGLVTWIGYWVFRQACQQMAKWKKLGHDDLCLAINISPKQLAQKSLAKYMYNTMEKYGVSPKMLCVEVTENTIMNNRAVCRTAIESLKKIGVKLHIDDFGIGESSMEYLQQLPIDALNIDRSFVMNIADRQQDGTTAKAIIAMAHSMGLKVLAEGVETRAQAEFLRDHRCDALQGHLFSPAVPAQAIELLLESVV